MFIIIIIIIIIIIMFLVYVDLDIGLLKFFYLMFIVHVYQFLLYGLCLMFIFF